MNTKSLLAIFISVLALTGCIPIRHNCLEGSFVGIRSRLDETTRNNTTLHIIMIHGMNDHCPGYGETFAQNLTKALQLRTNADETFTTLPSDWPDANVLREFSSSQSNSVIKFHELTWTPTTLPEKTKAFEKDRRFKRGRVLVNAKLKHDVIDEGFGDAILYLSPGFHTRMQDPIVRTLKKVTEQTRPGDKIILVASSLGSKMTFDAVQSAEESQEPGILSQQHITDFKVRTTDIIMLANQVPLLNLGARTNSLKAFTGKSVHEKSKSSENENASFFVNVVAATDPNDLLSYPLKREDVLPDDRHSAHVSLGNIYSHNTSAILGLFVWPTSAHEDYDKNRWVMRQLVTGFSNEGHECYKKPVKEDFTCRPKKGM